MAKQYRIIPDMTSISAVEIIEIDGSKWKKLAGPYMNDSEALADLRMIKRENNENN